VTVTDLGRKRCGIVTFTVADRAADDIVAALHQRKINTVSSSPRSTLLDATARKLPPVVRASVHYYNSEDEVARFAGALAELAGRATA
jgi:cysteine desulfurase / selenocysteine lyase